MLMCKVQIAFRGLASCCSLGFFVLDPTFVIASVSQQGVSVCKELMSEKKVFNSYLFFTSVSFQL